MNVQASIGSNLVVPGNFTIAMGDGGSIVDGFPVSDGNGRNIFVQAIADVETGATYRLDVEVANGYGIVRFGDHGISCGPGRHTVETVAISDHNLVCDYEEVPGQITSITIEKLTPIS